MWKYNLTKKKLKAGQRPVYSVGPVFSYNRKVLTAESWLCVDSAVMKWEGQIKCGNPYKNGDTAHN